MNAPDPRLSAAPRKYSVADIHHLLDKGIIAQDAKFELVEGEIRDMSPKGIAHERVKAEVNDWLVRALGAGFWVMVETTLYLSDDTFLEPDFVLVPRSNPLSESPTQKDVALAIEVSASSKTYDFGEKAALYAKYGVAEYWAIDAHFRSASVHRGPGAAGWADVRDVAAGEAVSPICAGNTTLTLGG